MIVSSPTLKPSHLFIPCIVSPSPAMAIFKCLSLTDKDPWDLSAFVTASAALLLSILFLLHSAICFLTSLLVKFFGLEPPCTYVGCSHPLQFHDDRNQERRLVGITSAKDYHDSCCQVSSCKALIQRNDPCLDHRYSCADDESYMRANQSKQLRHRSIDHPHSNSRWEDSHPYLPWPGSNLNGSATQDHCEMPELYVNCEQEGFCEEMRRKNREFLNYSSGSSTPRRPDRREQPRRKDIIGCRSSRKLIKALLPTEANLESSGAPDTEGCAIVYGEEAAHVETTQKTGDFPPHEMVSTRNIGEVNAVVADKIDHPADAIEMDHPADLSAAEIRTALTYSSSERIGGFDTKIQCSVGQVSTEPEQELEFQGDATFEDFTDCISALTLEGCGIAEDVGMVHASKLEQTQSHKSVLTCPSENGNTANLGNANYPNESHSYCKENLYLIQFGSIVASACISNGIRSINDSSEKNNFSASLVETGRGSSQGELGCGISWTDRKLLQIGSIVFVDSATPGENCIDLMTTHDVVRCTITNSSPDYFVGSSTYFISTEEDDEGREESIQDSKQEEDMDELKLVLQTERLMVAALEVELENERNAAAVATNEAMAMIGRLQEEKSAMRMEVIQLQRESEERADYDEQAISILKDILVRKEAENMDLEKEVELYREKLLTISRGEPLDLRLNKVLSPSLQSRNRHLLITGQDTDCHSPVGQSTNMATPYTGWNTAIEECFTISADHTSNKRSRESHVIKDRAAFERWGDVKDDLDRPTNDVYEWETITGKRSQFTDEPRLMPEAEFLSTQRLQEHPEGDETNCKKPLPAMGNEEQHLSSTMEKKRPINSVTESCGIQSKHRMGGEEDEGCGIFVPIHDVYEVYPDSSLDSPPAKKIELLEVFDVESTDNELLPRVKGNITESPPSLQAATTPTFLTGENPVLPSSMSQETDWGNEKFYTEDLHERRGLPTLLMVSKEKRQAEEEVEEVKQLEVRLKALEQDRELLRETVHSFKQRDAELGMLQEISKHLQELRAVNCAGADGRAVSDELSVSSPSRIRPLKKRRFCSSFGRAQACVHLQRNV